MASSTATFFKERAEVDALVLQCASEESLPALEAVVKRMEEILGKYQEQPSLLDGHLNSIIAPIMARIRSTLIAQHAACIQSQLSEASGSLVIEMRASPAVHKLFQIVYLVSKTRGYKHIVRLMPHEVADLEPALLLLRSQDRGEHSTWETRYVLFLWLSILVLVPFDLTTADSMSSEPSGAAGSGAASAGGIISRIVTACQQYLDDAGPVREAAALCLAKLLTRPDLDTLCLRSVLEWCSRELFTLTSAFNDGRRSLNAAVEARATGIMQVLVEIGKLGHRSSLLEHLTEVFHNVVQFAGSIPTLASTLLRKLTVKFATRTGLSHMPPRLVPWRYQRGHRSLLDNLVGSGTASVPAVTPAAAPSTPVESLPEEDAADVPEELEEILDMLLTGLRDKDTVVRWSAAKGIGRITGRLPKDCADDVVAAVLMLLRPEESDGAWHGGCLAAAELARRGLLLPERLPEAVPKVLEALKFDLRRGAHSVGTHVRDAGCYVCWAFARAYAPEVMKPFVLQLSQGMLTCAVFDRELNCRRAAAAAFQENVGRQGHQNFDHGIEILTMADYFTLGNRTHAFLEVSFGIAQFPHYRYALWENLQTVKLFHWDEDIRELSAKALGKFAGLDPKHAVEVTLEDLLPRTTSQQLFERHGSILAIAETVLVLSRCGVTLSEDLLSNIRNIVPRAEKARAYRGRGGELVRGAMCRLIECICLGGHPLTSRAAFRLLDTLDDCLKHPFDSIQRSASAALKALCVTAFMGSEMSPQLLDRLPRQYATKLTQDDNPAVRRGVALALGSLPKPILLAAPLRLCLNSLITATTPEAVVSRRDAETRRNAVEGLSALVSEVGLAVHGSTGLSSEEASLVFDALIRATEDYATDNRGDVGSWVRIASVQALLSFAAVLCGAPGKVLASSRAGPPGCDLPLTDSFLLPSAEERAKHFLLPDARAAAMSVMTARGPRPDGLVYIPPARVFSPAMSASMVQALLRLVGEKLDIVRSAAGDALTALVHNSSGLYPISGVPLLARLRSLLPKGGGESVNWAAAGACFPVLVPLLTLQPYVDSVIAGLVTSVGGLSESVMKSAGGALSDWATSVKRSKDFALLNDVSSSLLRILSGSSSTAPSDAPSDAAAGAGGSPAVPKTAIPTRLIVPTLRTLHQLLAKGCLDELQGPKFTFAADLVRLTRLRVMKSTDAVRVMEGVSVFLGALVYEPPVRLDALLSLLDLLCHDFPKVRKVTAENLYIRMLTLEDAFGGAGSEAVLSGLSSLDWSGPIAQCCIARDALYEPLGLSMPAIRMGLNSGDPALAGAALREAQPTTFDSYESLVKETGY